MVHLGWAGTPKPSQKRTLPGRKTIFFREYCRLHEVNVDHHYNRYPAENDIGLVGPFAAATEQLL